MLSVIWAWECLENRRQYLSLDIVMGFPPLFLRLHVLSMDARATRCTGLEQPAFGHCVLVLGQFILWWFRVNRCLYQAPQDRCQGDSTLPVSALLSIYDTNHPSKICSEKNFKYRCLAFMDEQMLSAESEMCRIATGQLLTLLPSRASSSWTNGIHGLDRLSPLHISPKFHLSFLRASALDESLCFAICVQKGCSVT